MFKADSQIQILAFCQFTKLNKNLKGTLPCRAADVQLTFTTIGQIGSLKTCTYFQSIIKALK